jgi:iron complex transport system substrate-binding protein
LTNTGTITACIISILLAFLPAHSMAHAKSDAAPRRVVSMNLCTDQLALLIAAPGQLHSVSYVAHDPDTSVLSAQARHYKPNHGLAEEIFLMKPDLILAGNFTRPSTTELLRRLGFRVETFNPAQSLAEIRSNMRRIGDLLHRSAYTKKLLATFDTDLRQIKQLNSAAPRKRAALYYANNYTSGSGTLANDIVAHAGLDNIGTQLGLNGIVKLPLEILIIGAPDVIIAEQRDSKHAALAYQTFAHPALRAATGNAAAFLRTDISWSCGAPFTLGAVRRLQAAVRAIKHTPTKSRAPR